METGNPKQVAVLAILAVGALGFLVTRMGGKAAPAALAATAAAHASASHPFVALGVVRDPFSHPHLAQKVASNLSTFPFPNPDKRPTFSMVGSLPSADRSPLVPTIPTISKADPLPKAVAPAPSSTGITVGLDATAGATDSVAFITVGGAESRPFRPNERIQGSIRVLRVEDGSVVLTSPKGKLTLGVGERKTL